MVVPIGVLEKDGATNGEEFKEDQILPLGWLKVHCQQNWTL